jgi:hypothetical protein
MSVEKQKHPLSALTTYELTEYRGKLECAVKEASADTQTRAGLRLRLDEVLAEQDDRARLAARA